MTPIDRKTQTLIINNLVAACKDISKLNGTGYRFINLASGFIAHYDLNGFKSYYGTGTALKRDILVMQHQNQWGNFRPGEREFEYYQSKREVYNAVCVKLWGTAK